MAATPSYVSRDSVDELDTLTPGRSHLSHATAAVASSSARGASPSARAASRQGGRGRGRDSERGATRGRGRSSGGPGRGLVGGLRGRGGRVSAPTRIEVESDYETSEQQSDGASLRSPTLEDEDEEEEEGEEEAAVGQNFEEEEDEQRGDEFEEAEDGTEEDRQESEDVRQLGAPAAPASRRTDDPEVLKDQASRRIQQPRRVSMRSPSPRPSPPVSSSPMPPPPVAGASAEAGPSRMGGNPLGEPLRLASPKIEPETPVPFDHRIQVAPGGVMGPPSSHLVRPPPGARSSPSPDHGVFARPLPPRQLQGQHNQPEGEEEGDRQSSVIVFQCDGCKSILGDSLSWVCARQDLGVVVLSSVTESVTTGPGRSTWTGADDMAGFTYESLSCVHCTLELGKMWRTTSREFDEVRDNFCLSLNCLKIYEVGSCAAQNEELPVQSDELFAGGFEARLHAQQAQHQSHDHEGPDGFAPASEDGTTQTEEAQKMRMLLMAMGERLMRVERELDDIKRERGSTARVGATPSSLGRVGGGSGSWGGHALSASAAAAAGRERGGPRVSFSDDEPTPTRNGMGGRAYAPGAGAIGPSRAAGGMAGWSGGSGSGADRGLLNRMAADRERERERERQNNMGPAARRRRLA